MKPGSITHDFLRQQRRRSRGTLLAWAGAAALAAPAWEGAVRLGWVPGSIYWSLLPAAAAAYLLVRWCRRVWRLDERAVARETDARWSLRARLESAVELAGGDSPVAAAQRADAERQLESRKPVGTGAWLGGIAAALLGLALVGCEQAALIRRAHVPKAPPASAAAPAAAPIVPAPAPPPEPLHASIAWKSPAKAAGAVPLLAHAQSNKGFRAMTLEVALNGKPTNSYPVPAIALGALAKPGEGDLKLSLFPDETGAKPYDIVSYYLRAEADLPPAFPVVVSPLQFVEVLPAEPVPESDPRYPADARELLRRLDALKQAQMDLIARNFQLIQAGTADVSLERTTENGAVASAQTQLAPATDEARDFANRIRAPQRVAADLAQAAPLMTQAGAQISAQANPAAAPLQAQALALLADTERSFRQALEAKPSPAAPDPFKRLRDTGLKPRGQTPAGRLEQLALRQAASTRRLEQAAPGSPDLPAITAEQAAVARDASKLAAEHTLTDSAEKSLDAAAKAAAEAARQLGLDDLQAAREPAAEAQASLQHAVEAQEADGRKAAAAVLEQVRQELNDADRLKDQAARAAQRDQVRRELSTEAERQQQQGSAEAAQKLAALAKKLDDSKPQDSKPPSSPASPKSPPPSAPSSSNPPPAAGAQSPAAGGASGDDDEPTHLYVAALRPLPGAETSTASGSASLLLGTGYLTARIDVTVEHLPSAEAGGRILAGGTGEKGTVVLVLARGKISHRDWNLKPAGTMTRGELMTALESGHLYLEIDTATHATGELGGPFLPQGPPGGGGKGSGPGSGSGSDSGSGSGSNPGSSPESGSGDTGSDLGRGNGARRTTNRAPVVFTPPPTDDLTATPPATLVDASVTAAETEASLSPDSALAQTIRQLKAAAARLSGPDNGSAGLSALELAAQEARWLTGDVKLADSAQNIAEGAGRDVPNLGGLGAADRKALADRARQLAQALEQARSAAKRDEWVRRFAPEDIDPDYRKPVEDYFENLSREGAAR